MFKLFVGPARERDLCNFFPAKSSAKLLLELFLVSFQLSFRAVSRSTRSFFDSNGALEKYGKLQCALSPPLKFFFIFISVPSYPAP